MPITNRVTEIAKDAVGWRHHLHTIPELCYEEFKTSAYIQDILKDFNVDDVHVGLAKTGVVVTIKNGTSKRSIALRTDMDALPITEASGVDYTSQHEGKMHACGHDGHMGIMLGVAKYLSETRNFDGTVYLYFQPAEEGGNGAETMIKDGLFEKFRPDEVYGLHNWPGIDIGQFSVREGPVMSAAGKFDLIVHGQGGHGANPHMCNDPIMIGTQILTNFQTLISRRANPQDTLVISATYFNAGTTYNIIPNSIHIKGTVRSLKSDLVKTAFVDMEKMARDTASANNATIEFSTIYDNGATVNTPNETGYARQVCENMVGAENVIAVPPSMTAEDFSFMLEEVPGCYIYVGNGDSAGKHTPDYIFNDEAIPYSIDYFIKMVESRLAK